MRLHPNQHQRLAQAYIRASKDKSLPPEKRAEYLRKSKLWIGLAKRAARKLMH